MSHIIIFGSIGFFIVTLITIGLILWALDRALSDSHDNGGGGLATLFVLGFITLYYFFGSQNDVHNALSYIISNPHVIITWFLGYLGFGVVWGFIKWYFFLHKQATKELKKVNTNDISIHSLPYTPTANENKWRIISWMTYWPFSALWTVLDQPVKYAFNYIFTKIENVFNRISNQMFKEVNKQFEAKKVEMLMEERKREAQYQEKLNKRKEDERLAIEELMKGYDENK